MISLFLINFLLFVAIWCTCILQWHLLSFTFLFPFHILNVFDWLFYNNMISDDCIVSYHLYKAILFFLNYVFVFGHFSLFVVCLFVCFTSNKPFFTVPGTVLRSLHVLPHLIFTIILWCFIFVICDRFSRVETWQSRGEFWKITDACGQISPSSYPNQCWCPLVGLRLPWVQMRDPGGQRAHCRFGGSWKSRILPQAACFRIRSLGSSCRCLKHSKEESFRCPPNAVKKAFPVLRGRSVCRQVRL